MPSIDEILNDLGVGEETEKIASTSISEDEIFNEAKKLGLIESEKTASAINTEGESNMDLQGFYNDMFEEGQEKVAASNVEYQEDGQEYEYMDKTAAAEHGELTGVFFNEKMDNLLDEVVMLKTAEEIADSAATQDAQRGPGAVAAGNVVDGGVMLPVNRPADAAQKIDTTPQHYDLLDAAVAKAKIEKAIENAEIPAELDHRTVQTASGLEMPAKQTV